MFEILRKLLASKQPPPFTQPEPVDFKLLTEGSNDVIFRTGLDGTTFYVSPSSERVLGWKPEEMLGKGPAEFVLPEDLPAVISSLETHMEGRETSGVACRVRCKDGTTVWLEASARMVSVNGGPELVVVLRDISDRKRLEEHLSHLALTDSLTGLANRRAFDAALDKEWARAKRHNGHLSLLLIDLDRFKAFNDHYGHQVGDDCLRATASAIQSAVRRPADLAARYGGEEIAVILPDTDAAGAIKIAEDIRNVVCALNIPHAANHSGAGIVTISTGAATALSIAGASVQRPAALLQAADTALYKAKHNGRDRIETALLLSGDESGPGAI